MEQKECKRCHVLYPLDKNFWHRNNHASDGFRNTCRMCRSEEVEDKRREAIDQRITALEEGGIDILGKLTRGGSEVPHMAETFQRIMEAFGGPGGFAQQLIATYYRAAPGSQLRQRIQSDIIRLNIKVSESGAAKRSLEEITTEELDDAMKKKMKEILTTEVNTSYVSPEYAEEEKKTESG